MVRGGGIRFWLDWGGGGGFRAFWFGKGEDGDMRRGLNGVAGVYVRNRSDMS